MERLGCFLSALFVMMVLGTCAAWAEGIPWPETAADGFLEEGEFVYFDSENGLYGYLSADLKVSIERLSTDKPRRVWFEAEIWAREGTIFRALPNSLEKRMTRLAYPYKIARKNRTVFGINGDFAHLRISKKAKPGILVRDGELISDNTGPKNRKLFPNLDTLAIFPDGDMQVFWSNELEGEAYLDMGAVDVISFGPYLIRDGELNETALKKYGTGSAQRTAIGMAEKGHYFAIMVEGRHKKSIGSSIRFAAERLYEKGCTVAMNLDGGQSSCMLFMGYQISTMINTNGRQASARRSAEILGIGTSDSVAGEDEKMQGPAGEGVLISP